MGRSGPLWPRTRLDGRIYPNTTCVQPEASMPTDPTHISLKQLEAMRAGARVAARTCMGIGPVDRVFILTDRPTHGIGRLLAEEASEAGGEVLVRDLEQYAERPSTAVPEQLRSDLRRVPSDRHVLRRVQLSRAKSHFALPCASSSWTKSGRATGTCPASPPSSCRRGCARTTVSCHRSRLRSMTWRATPHAVG